MSEVAKLFPLFAGGKVRVELEVSLEGENFTLIHVFREPDVEDRKAYWSFLGHSELRAESQGGRADYLGASEVLYDRCALSAEGYDFPEAEGAGWKVRVPLEHKAWAVTRLLARSGSLEESGIKN